MLAKVVILGAIFGLVICQIEQSILGQLYYPIPRQVAPKWRTEVEHEEPQVLKLKNIQGDNQPVRPQLKHKEVQVVQLKNIQGVKELGYGASVGDSVGQEVPLAVVPLRRVRRSGFGRDLDAANAGNDATVARVRHLMADPGWRPEILPRKTLYLTMNQLSEY